MRNTHLFRRLRLTKAKPQPQSASNVEVEEEKGYRCHFDDDDFVHKTLDDENDTDVVWESLSSLTLQDNGLQSSSGRLSSSPFMMLDDSSNVMSSSCPLIDTIVKGATDATLLSIAEHFPGLLGHCDAHGRFPVHAACAFAASPDFIYKCVSMYPHTAAAQDDNGRTPFHFLCKSYAMKCHASMFWDKDAIEKFMTRILWILYRKAPRAIVLEDNYGVDVVEYALEADMSMTFIRLLHNMVARVHKQNAKMIASRKLIQIRCPTEQKASPEDTHVSIEIDMRS